MHYIEKLYQQENVANRNPDISMYLEISEKWKEESNNFKKDIRKFIKPQEVFKNLIEDTRKNIKLKIY